MDYMGILKKAWNVTWRYKILWLFGFFAGAGFGGGNGGGSGTGYRTGSSQTYNNVTPAQVQAFLAQYMGVIVMGVIALVVIGLVFLVIGVAARGGIVYLVNEAEEGREVRAGDGWRAGFSKWWRVFGIGFLAALPGLILLAIVIVAFGGALVSAGAMAAGGASNQDILNALGASILGGTCFLIVAGLIVAVLSVMLGISAQLGIQYAVLQDRGVMDSLKQGWRDLWGKRGAFVLFLVQLAVSIVVGIVIGIVGAILAVPALVAAGGGAPAIGGLMGLVAALVFVVPLAIYAAFYHATWTIFFRRMTGMEPVPAMAAAPMPPAGYSGGFPPAPPVAPAPPAPPAPPMMETPPAPMAPEPPAMMPEPPAMMPEPPVMAPEPPAAPAEPMMPGSEPPAAPPESPDV